LQPERKKSKFEVMQEVMAKSKLAKLERQQMREKDDDIRMELDEGLDDIRALLLGVPSTSSSEPKPRSVPERAPIPSQAPAERELTKEEREKKESDQYDAYVREMAFERRAKPQDRLKTEEELALEEAESLRKAEEARLRRMRGEEEPKEKEKGKKARRAPGGDDLDDDLDLDEDADAYGLGQGLGDREEDEEGSESEEEEESGSEEEGSDAGSDEEGSNATSEDAFEDVADLAELSKAGDDADDVSDDEASAALSGSQRATTSSKGKSKSTSSAASLPFTFSCPATHDEFLSLLEEHSVAPTDVPLVISRIRALHHASLGEDNKHKLAALIGVLLDHCLFVAPDASAGGFRLVGKITPHLFALSSAYPRAAAQHFVGKLALMQRNLSRGLARGALLPQARTWPGVAELTLLRLAGIIFPTSDKTHPVATPLSLLIAQYLAHARLRSLRDLASATYLVSLVAAHEREARRLVPEALNALHSAVLILAPLHPEGKKDAATIASAFAIPTPDFGAPHTQHLRLSGRGAGKEDETLPSLTALLEVADDDADAEQAKRQLLGLSLSLIAEFATLYAGSTAFCELFTPFNALLALIDHASLPASLSAQVTQLTSTLTRALSLAASQRRALRLQAHRAIPIASHIPKFEQRGYDPSRKGQHDPDTERAAQAKTKALIKKERKGAVKELRRDAQFVAEERRKAKEQEDTSYAKKIARVMGSLGEEQREEKVWKREKEK
jgi:nucleolar protein 14